jgi:hypothetical protein
MHCNGKCVLIKKLKEHAKKDLKDPDRKIENKFQLFCSSFRYMGVTPRYTVTISEFPVYKDNISPGFLSFSFHPPQA